jgi:hypothetical protein
MVTVHFVNKTYLELPYKDWLELRKAITAKEKFVKLNEDNIEFINLDMVTHIINTDKEDK